MSYDLHEIQRIKNRYFPKRQKKNTPYDLNEVKKIRDNHERKK